MFVSLAATSAANAVGAIFASDEGMAVFAWFFVPAVGAWWFWGTFLNEDKTEWLKYAHEIAVLQPVAVVAMLVAMWTFYGLTGELRGSDERFFVVLFSAAVYGGTWVVLYSTTWWLSHVLPERAAIYRAFAGEGDTGLFRDDFMAVTYSSQSFALQGLAAVTALAATFLLTRLLLNLGWVKRYAGSGWNIEGRISDN